MTQKETAMRMWTLIPAAVLAMALAGCGDEPPQPRTAATPPQPTTSAPGAAAGGSSQPLPANPQGTKADAKPDPGDANDHSNPQHDSRNKKDRD